VRDPDERPIHRAPGLRRLLQRVRASAGLGAGRRDRAALELCWRDTARRSRERRPPGRVTASDEAPVARGLPLEWYFALAARLACFSNSPRLIGFNLGTASSTCSAMNAGDTGYTFAWQDESGTLLGIYNDRSGGFSSSLVIGASNGGAAGAM